MPKQLRILHLEDDPTDAELIRSLLEQEGFQCSMTRVVDRSEFRVSLTSGSYDIILCDYNLPSFDGVSALKIAFEMRPSVPFIFVSGTIGEERAIEALKLGATDYVLKTRLERLGPAVSRAVREVEERQARRQLELQLERAQRLESIGTLAGGIAHDFNNILSIIMGYATLAGKHADDPEKHGECLEAITRAAERGASFVRQLLTFAGRRDVPSQPLSINAAVREHVSLLEQTLPRSITIAADLADGLQPLLFDPSQMQQILLNLSVNARDAMPEGGRLEFRTRAVKGETLGDRTARFDDYIVLEVSDTGTGMNEQARRRIFEPFFTTKGEGKGTGLGLSVVFGIVGRNDGFIEVQSAVGKGTTFLIFFPVKPVPAASVIERSEREEFVKGGTETLLIVEDEEMLRKLIRTVLVGEGYRVMMAADGAEAVAMYRDHGQAIQLVISDLDLPRLNGEQVLKAIREINPAAKFIIATGFIEPEVRSEIEQAGATTIIQKPYQPDDVLAKVRNVLDQ